MKLKRFRNFLIQILLYLLEVFLPKEAVTFIDLKKLLVGKVGSSVGTIYFPKKYPNAIAATSRCASFFDLPLAVNSRFK